MLRFTPLIGLAFGSAFPPPHTSIYPQFSMVNDGPLIMEYPFHPLLFCYELPNY
jgi:hypothetical protein